MALFWQETLRVPPHLQEPFFGSFAREYLPAAQDAGLCLLGCWNLSSIKGDAAEIVVLWEIAGGWPGVDLLRRALQPSPSAAPLREWHDRSAIWVREREGVLLRKLVHAGRPETQHRGDVAGSLCLHETMHIQPNMEPEYVRAIGLQLGQAMANRGLRSIGVFQPILGSGRIINLWSVHGGLDALNAMGVVDPSILDPDELFDGQYWFEIGTVFRQHWRSVWMIPSPLARIGNPA